MALEIAKYEAMKAAGKISVFKIGPTAAAIATPKYDVSTGEQMESDLNTFNLANIDKDIARLTADIAALKVLRADVAAALAK